MNLNDARDKGAICQNCKWWALYGMVCCNDASERCGYKTYTDFTCNKWEGNGWPGA